MTYDVGNPGPGLGQAQKCGGVKKAVNGILSQKGNDNINMDSTKAGSMNGRLNMLVKDHYSLNNKNYY